MIIFYTVDNKGNKKQFAKYANGKWFGNYKSIVDELKHGERAVLGGREFDFDNPKDYDALPYIFSGSLMWAESKVVVTKGKRLSITIQSEEEDDWMKSLPGYEDEVKLHEELAAKLDNKE